MKFPPHMFTSSTKPDKKKINVFFANERSVKKSGAHQMEPPSPSISYVNPFPSRFINRTACFPQKVSYFRESRMSPWKKWSWMKSNSEARPDGLLKKCITKRDGGWTRLRLALASHAGVFRGARFFIQAPLKTPAREATNCRLVQTDLDSWIDHHGTVLVQR